MSCLKRNNSLITLSLFLFLVLGACTTTPNVNDVTDINVSHNKSDSFDVSVTFNTLKKVREEAISLKAPKAAPTEFNSGESYRSEGLDFYNNNHTDKAYESYLLAIKQYEVSIDLTNTRREMARNALSNADRAILKTEDNANRALKEGEEEEL